MKFKSLRVFANNPKLKIPKAEICELELEDLSAGEVLIRAEYSCVNYKDALAVTGRGKILRKFPLNPGIDVSGTVVESNDPIIKKGCQILINGSGLGETRDGGFSEFVRVPANIVTQLPIGLSTREAMILGTAGFTSALSLKRMEINGQKPEMGPILVTGASGGVGSCAIQILAQRGYKVLAVSGKEEISAKLKKYGALQVIKPENLPLGERPLEKALWAGVIDSVGGELLSKIIPHIHLWGNVACVGLADSPILNTTVMPMILRGVSILGSSSANCPIPLKEEIWKLLAKDWKPKYLSELVNSELSLEEVISYSERLLDRKTIGRALIRL